MWRWPRLANCVQRSFTLLEQDDCRAKILNHLQASEYHRATAEEGLTDFANLAESAEVYSETAEYTEEDRTRPPCF